MKKVLSLVLALSMMLSMAAISFAGGSFITDASKISNEVVAAALEGKTFEGTNIETVAKNQDAIVDVQVDKSNRVVKVFVTSSKLTSYDNGAGAQKWFPILLTMGNQATVTIAEPHEHEGYKPYSILSEDIGHQEHWAVGGENITTSFTAIIWLRASGDGYEKRVACFDPIEGKSMCVTFEIYEAAKSSGGGNSSGPSAAETAASEAKSDASSAVSSFSGIASELAALTGGLPMADAGTATAAQLEALCKQAGIKTMTVEAGGKKSVVPMISMDLGKMEGKFYYDTNDMLVGTGLYIEFKGSDGKLYVVPASALTKSAPNRIFFPESYLIALAINK